MFNLPFGAGYKIVETAGFSIAFNAGLGANFTVHGSHDHVDAGNNAQSYHADESSRFLINYCGGAEAFFGKKLSVAANYSTPIGTLTNAEFYPKHSAAQFTVRYGL